LVGVVVGYGVVKGRPIKLTMQIEETQRNAQLVNSWLGKPDDLGDKTLGSLVLIRLATDEEIDGMVGQLRIEFGRVAEGAGTDTDEHRQTRTSTDGAGDELPWDEGPPPQNTGEVVQMAKKRGKRGKKNNW
jgi:hypothetical protein